ncbi:g0 g1 switch protein 2 [Limosa lapponica baueri]|uniref:G0 g1 switch protein 2 n=1 Tax=Limosa lapponica baueri TaxID=1758121 RepID=A0A2I0TUS0_LIMLA|nr:g0 g1 switch protein 2 [Limosa lapponica baueri]
MSYPKYPDPSFPPPACPGALPKQELTSSRSAKKMETMHELIPFAKEMLSQKPNRKMVKLYMLGSVLAFFGVVIGLVETVCSPFTSEGRLEEEEEKKPAPTREQMLPQKQEDLILDKSKKVVGTQQRALVTRPHAS